MCQAEEARPEEPLQTQAAAWYESTADSPVPSPAPLDVDQDEHCDLLQYNVVPFPVALVGEVRAVQPHALEESTAEADDWLLQASDEALTV